MLASFGFNRLIYGNTGGGPGAGTPATSSGPPSETQSEISSVDSDWSDIRAIANKLGVQNPDDLHTERFKVDRQKLENMIKSEFFIFIAFLSFYYIIFYDVIFLLAAILHWTCTLHFHFFFNFSFSYLDITKLMFDKTLSFFKFPLNFKISLSLFS